MTSSVLPLTLLTLLMPALTVLAAESPFRSSAGSFEVVLLTESRPIWLRVHVQTAGKPLTQRFDDALREQFRFFDRNNDGHLDEAEAKHVFSIPSLESLMVSPTSLFSAGGETRHPVVKFTDLDANQDGEVSLDEFRTYYRSVPSRLFRLRSTQQIGLFNSIDADAINRDMLKALDTNGDGRLSRAELDQAPQLLNRLDTNEDEYLTLTELMPSDPTMGFRRGFRQPGRAPGPDPINAQAFPTGPVPETVVSWIVKKYDRNADGTLTRAEIGWDEELFARLDTDRDGQLSASEVATWFAGQPQASFDVSLGQKSSDCSIRQTDTRDAVSQKRTVELGKQKIDLSVAPSAPLFATQFFVQSFRQADTDNNGYLDLKEVNALRAQYVFRPIFAVADRDGDGKLTFAEAEAYWNTTSAMGGMIVSAVFGMQQVSWFERLDRNGDGRLSRRELRDAWQTLSETDSDGPGFVRLRPAETMVGMSMYLGQQPPPALSARYVPQYGGAGLPIERVEKGPLWFRKLDKNGDGDLSEREWVGPLQTFRRLDRDGDGLISWQEAEQADQDARGTK